MHKYYLAEGLLIRIPELYKADMTILKQDRCLNAKKGF